MKLFSKRKRRSGLQEFKAMNRTPGIHSRSSASRKFKSKLLQRKIFRTALTIIGALLLGTILLGGGYFSVRYVIGLRSDTSDSVVSEAGFVVGFDDIPAFPGSSFIFENYPSNDVLRQFLSNGNAIYRLSPGVKFSDVTQYYVENLPAYDWELVNSVPLESEEMLPGDYWVKEDRAVRIYSEFNDIWYQSVSVKQAKNGLKDEVKKETERKLLLATSDYTDLLPDFPWRLKVPNEYLTDYSGTDLEDLQKVTFKQIGHSNDVVLEPVGYIGAIPYDSYLDAYLKKTNKKNKTNWNVVNSVVVTVADQEAIRASLTNGSSLGESVVVGNPRNSIVYILTTHEENDPFFEYILDHISPANSSY